MPAIPLASPVASRRLMPAPTRCCMRPAAAAAVAPVVAQHAGDGRGRPRPGLIETWWVESPGDRRAGRHGAGVSRRDADADDFRRRRWAVAFRPPSRAHLAPGRRADGGLSLVLHAVLINVVLGRDLLGGWCCLFDPASVSRAGRQRRLPGRGAALFQCGVRRHGAAVADERAGERDPRHRQHADAGAGDLRAAWSC